MKQYQWEVELLRKVDGGLKPIRKAKVWEFDDECLGANLWIDAVDEFKEEVQVGDVIITRGHKIEFIEYMENGGGRVL